MEMLIRHDGRNWVAENGAMTFRGSTLEEIDAQVSQFMKDEGLVGEGERVKVKMFFDNSTIPQWMRQYSQHYFNSILEVKG